ncbi:uncharacterized protein VTP21DRAFT_4643 [Calcarisporiella thermophila]|uniref:uncharacterized protein n=1 Tax=Calcarisporiella thermophila TaxID=911321 RepID=UPI0037446D87
MGCCQSVEEKESSRRNKEIEEQLKNDRLNLRKEIKMLLLGAGESGKSTILKQMKLIHDGSYTRDEKESYREIVFSNIIQSMVAVLNAMDGMGLQLADANKHHAQVILSAPTNFEGDRLPSDIAAACKELWFNDEKVRACVDRSREFQLNDSAKYYFDAIDRIAQPDYLPTDQDVLRSRVKTTGITESTFQVGDITYRLFDVGGQRSERKKWIHCFENVTALLFLVAISEYDQQLREDETVNRMQESLTLFDSICNSRWFVNTNIVLFLNKTDLFREKLPRSPLNKYFPEYQVTAILYVAGWLGSNDFDSACEFFLEKFVSLNQSETKQIYTHFTCATDTQQVTFVMNSVNDIVVQSSLRDCGLL